MPPWANIGTRTEPGSTLCQPDDFERKLTCAQSDHDEPPPLIRRIGLVVAPAAERHRLVEVDVQLHPVRSVHLGRQRFVAGARTHCRERADEYTLPAGRTVCTGSAEAS